MNFSGLEAKVKGTLVYDAPMSRYTTWRIGGNADCLFLPEDGEDIVAALSLPKTGYPLYGHGEWLQYAGIGWRYSRPRH